ncbi:hypothetical protein [uncultured Sulfitobacter sp.]|uniref:hypothetical protein n=1 Tax=uncultured Sulfitobacter sp. TaxID=191468 RepID=UPI002635152D|nr:hypothetical protein [uncultured Sulfitobacter sp.]
MSVIDKFKQAVSALEEDVKRSSEVSKVVARRRAYLTVAVMVGLDFVHEQAGDHGKNLDDVTVEELRRAFATAKADGMIPDSSPSERPKWMPKPHTKKGWEKACDLVIDCIPNEPSSDLDRALH